MSRQIRKIVIHHSVSPRDQTLEKSIQSFDRNHAQRLHTTKNSLGYHIAYHWVVAWDWSYRQTRGDHEIGYHASNYDVNKDSIGICLTGNFDVEQPAKAQYESVKKIIKKYPDTTVHGHNQFASKSCPGKNLDFNKLLDMFYKELWEKHIEDKVKVEDRNFKYPEAFSKNTEGLSIEDKMQELVYLMAFLFDKWSDEKK